MLLEVQSYNNETITLKDCEGDGVYTLSHEWAPQVHVKTPLYMFI